jgi:hypothetical protein
MFLMLIVLSIVESGTIVFSIVLLKHQFIFVLNLGRITDVPTRMISTTTNHCPSQILFIRNLVRPFTICQLKNLLAKYGKLVDDEFWCDDLRSQCFVQVSVIKFEIFVSSSS